MTSHEAAPAPRLQIGDVVITLFLLAVFVMAHVLSGDWPFRTAFFPRLLASAGVGLAILKLVGFGIQLRRGTKSLGTTEHPVTGSLKLVSEEEEEDRSLEYVFATAGARAWMGTVAWIAGFFVALYVLGVFVTVPVFAFAYLKLSGGASWLAAAVYAAVAGAVIWLAFSELLTIQMPTGLF